MKINSIGRALKGAALFTIGSELTKAAIQKGREKWRERKNKDRQAQEDDEDSEIKSKLDK